MLSPGETKTENQSAFHSKLDSSVVETVSPNAERIFRGGISAAARHAAANKMSA